MVSGCIGYVCLAAEILRSDCHRAEVAYGSGASVLQSGRCRSYLEAKERREDRPALRSLRTRPRRVAYIGELLMKVGYGAHADAIDYRNSARLTERVRPFSEGCQLAMCLWLSLYRFAFHVPRKSGL